MTLRRYIDLPALIYLLSERKLTLLSPQTWDDKNDSYFLELYRKKKRLKTVLAACFTESSETYHHWRVYTSGNSGVCIVFDEKKLFLAVDRYEGIRRARVQYLTLRRVRGQRLKVNDLPFRKRYAFGAESEYRIIRQSKRSLGESVDLDIPLSCIVRVVISPWMHAELSGYVGGLLARIPGCAKLKVTRSSLISSSEWRRYGERATKQPLRAGRSTKTTRHKRDMRRFSPLKST